MDFCKKRHVLVIFIGVFVLGCLWSCAKPKRHRIGNKSPVIADVEPLLQACLNMCAGPGELRGRTRKVCVESCYELRREFPFLDKGYSNYELCAKDMDNLDLNRDTIIAELQAKCPEVYQTSLQRQACKDAAETFYMTATTDKVCLSASRAVGTVIKPVTGPGGTSASTTLQPAGPTIYDTPKYSEGRRRAAKATPATKKVVEPQKPQPVQKAAPAIEPRKPAPPQKDAPAPKVVQEPAQKTVPEITKQPAQPEPAAPATLHLKPGEENKNIPAEPGKPAPNRENAPVITPGTQTPPAAPQLAPAPAQPQNAGQPPVQSTTPPPAQ